jgi:hypothetical protein
VMLQSFAPWVLLLLQSAAKEGLTTAAATRAGGIMHACKPVLHCSNL